MSATLSIEWGPRGVTRWGSIHGDLGYLCEEGPPPYATCVLIPDAFLAAEGQRVDYETDPDTGALFVPRKAIVDRLPDALRTVEDRMAERGYAADSPRTVEAKRELIEFVVFYADRDKAGDEPAVRAETC